MRAVHCTTDCTHTVNFDWAHHQQLYGRVVKRKKANIKCQLVLGSFTFNHLAVTYFQVNIISEFILL